ncbi:MAG: NifU family protein [Bacilli bacterium]
MENKEITMEQKIEEALDKFRPFLQNDGGNIKFEKFEDGITYVSFKGACTHCPMQSATLNTGIKELLVNEIEGIIDVVSI